MALQEGHARRADRSLWERSSDRSLGSFAIILTSSSPDVRSAHTERNELRALGEGLDDAVRVSGYFCRSYRRARFGRAASATISSSLSVSPR